MYYTSTMSRNQSCLKPEFLFGLDFHGAVCWTTTSNLSLYQSNYDMILHLSWSSYRIVLIPPIPNNTITFILVFDNFWNLLFFSKDFHISPFTHLSVCYTYMKDIYYISLFILPTFKICHLLNDPLSNLF